MGRTFDYIITGALILFCVAVLGLSILMGITGLIEGWPWWDLGVLVFIVLCWVVGRWADIGTDKKIRRGETLD